MNGFSKLAAMSLVAMLCVAGASAQMMRGGPPQFNGVWNPIVGQGAVYQVTKEAGKNTEIEIAVLGKETVNGKDGYWLEMATSTPEMSGQVVTKFLFVLDGQETRAVKTIMQMPGHPPMEMPPQMTHHEHSSQPADIRTDARDLGSESITVPAGTFTCEHYRSKDGSESWLAKEVPPWGLAKHQGKDSTMVLVKVITDAKDKIVGTPQPFNPMMMMGQPPPQ
jgi:hypothetical protein